MTRIRLRTLGDQLGQPGPINARLTATATSLRVDAADVTFPAIVKVSLDGTEQELDLIAPNGTWAWRFEVFPVPGGSVLKGVYTFEDVPAIDWADMTLIDPSTLEPLQPLPPNAQEILVQAGEARDDALDARDVAVGVSTGLPAAAATAVGAQVEVQVAPLVSQTASSASAAAGSASSAEASAAAAVTTTILEVGRRTSNAPTGTTPIPVPAGGALLNHSATTWASIYWPFVINVEHIPGALGKWYMYFSTDHDTGAGGIGLAYANDLLGPWTFHPTFKYVDAVVGDQTETPSVMWNEATNLFHMFYQQEGSGLNQSTFLATSPDGLVWTRVGMVIQGIVDVPGDGQTTYLKPFRVGRRWVGYHLLGGGNYARTGISYSEDGRNWYTDPRRFGTYVDLHGDNTKRLSMATAMVFQWRGRPWAIVKIGPNQSGFVVGGDQWFVVELTPDLTGIAGSPARVFATLPAGVTESVVPTSVVEHDGKLYFFYRANGAYGAFRAVVVEA